MTTRAIRPLTSVTGAGSSSTSISKRPVASPGAAGNLRHLAAQADAGPRVRRDGGAIAEVEFHDVAIGKAGAHDIAAGQLPEQEHGLPRRDEFALLHELAQDDAVAGRDDRGVTAVELGGAQLGVRDLGLGTQRVQIILADGVVGLAAARRARGCDRPSPRAAAPPRPRRRFRRIRAPPGVWPRRTVSPSRDGDAADNAGDLERQAQLLARGNDAAGEHGRDCRAGRHDAHADPRGGRLGGRLGRAAGGDQRHDENYRDCFLDFWSTWSGHSDSGASSAQGDRVGCAGCRAR